MKTLKNHKLLIDNNCPMCQLYGSAFEKYNYVEKGTCLPYQKADLFFSNSVDSTRAKNEIALINTSTREVHYGVDAFRIILGKQWKLVDYLLQYDFTKRIVGFLYKFISQNRKVIAPSRLSDDVCRPDVQLKFRLLYVFLVALSSSLVIFQFTDDINQSRGWESSYQRELAICFGQIIWQLLFLRKYLKSLTWEYIGNMSTVSLIGTFLLFPGFLLPAQLRIVWFTFVVFIMTIEHIRRCKLLNISILATISWASYRLVALGLIMVLN